MSRIVGCILMILVSIMTDGIINAQSTLAAKKPVAVYVTDTDVEDNIKGVIQQKFISTLTQSKQYRVLERNSAFLKAIRNDRDYSLSGEVKDSKIAAIGKQYGAKFVLVVDVNELFDELVIQARMVDVESGSITESAEESSPEVSSVKQLMSLAERVASKVVNQSNNSRLSSNATSNNTTGGGQVETFTVNGVSFEMVRVDGGSYMMGSNEYSWAQPVHSETVGTFYIGKTEVTQRLWSAVMGNNPSKFRGENLPVDNVSWFDCQEFVERLSRLTGRIFRLPTEVEWEFAARGGTKSRGYQYSGSDDIYRVGWYTENSGSQTHPVGQKLDNELGIYDMSGNVWEWCSDNWSDNYSSPRNGSYRVFRGGSWYYTAANCRVAHRNYYAPGGRNSDLGLRLAL